MSSTSTSRPSVSFPLPPALAAAMPFWLCACVFALVCIGKVPCTQAAERPPNVVLILADDLGWVDTSLTGSRFYRTPNIERLAQRGVYFPHAYSASPLCSPTRASIMTGQNPARCGITSPACHVGKEVFQVDVHRSAKPTERQLNCSSVTRLSTDHITLAEALKQAGYATGHFGKWHLGREPYSPLEHGFDVDVPHWSGPGPAGSFVAPWRFPNFKERTPKEHIEDRMGDEAVAFMEKHKDESFFVNYWQFSVHAPFDAKQELIEQYRRNADPSNPQQSPTYAAMIHSLDDNVGKMLDALDRLGIVDNTVIIFYSDNGGNMYNMVDGDHTATSNAPLRGGKATMYEGGIRVPAIVSWPGVTNGGTTNSALIQSEDIYPTILGMAGAPPRPEQACDGLSMIPALRGQKPLRDSITCYFPHGPKVPDWLPPSVCTRQGDWKLIRVFHDAPDQAHRYELYNLADDLGERRNLAAEQPQRVRQLDALIEQFLADTGAVVPKPNPNYDSKAVESAGGWRVSGEARVGLSWTTLQVRSFSADVALTTDIPLELVPGRYVLQARVRSWADGTARVFWSKDGKTFADSHSAVLPINANGLWHEPQLELSIDAPADVLRLLPCVSQGTVQFAWIRLYDGVGKVVHEWDFKAEPKAQSRAKPQPQPVVGGWQAGANGHAILTLKDGLLVVVAGQGDPMLMTGEPLRVATGSYVFTLRMKATAKGGGQLFGRPEKRGYERGSGTPFPVTHDGQWHEITVTLERDHPIHELRLDPCSAPGVVEIDWIRLTTPVGDLVREWTFTGP